MFEGSANHLRILDAPNVGDPLFTVAHRRVPDVSHDVQLALLEQRIAALEARTFTARCWRVWWWVKGHSASLWFRTSDTVRSWWS